MKTNSLIYNLKDEEKFNIISLTVIFLSLLLSNLFVKSYFGIIITTFDFVTILFVPLLLTKINFILKLKFKNYLILFITYIFLILIFDIFQNYNYLNAFLLKKKILLFLQLLRSIIFSLIAFYFFRKMSKKFIDALIYIFALYCIIIILFLLVDVLLETNITSSHWDQRRLRGFFRDPNFLAFFSSFFLILSIYKNKNYFFTFIFTVTTFLTFSKTAFVFMVLFLITSHFFFIEKKFKYYEKILKHILIFFFFFFLFVLMLDLKNHFLVGNEPRIRFYTFFDILNQKRFIMLKDFITLDTNILFGKGFYELTNYSKIKYNNFSHNSFLDIYFDTGLIGFLLFLTLIFKMQKISLKNFNLNFLYYMLSFYLLFLMFFSVFSLFYLPYFWFFISILSNLNEKGKMN